MAAPVVSFMTAVPQATAKAGRFPEISDRFSSPLWRSP